MFTDQRYIANSILNSEKEIDLCPGQISDGDRDQQSAYSVISGGTVLGSSRGGENKEERYVRRRVQEEAGG
jgi:hypothetical protein